MENKDRVSWKKINGKTALEAALNEYNLSKGQFSNAMGISLKTLKVYDSSAGKISLDFFVKLCRLFGKKAYDLIETDEINPETINLSFQDFAKEITEARNNYIDAFDFYSDTKSENLETFSEYILKKIRKPLLAFIGTEESDKNRFLSLLLGKKIKNSGNPIFFIKRTDLPDPLSSYSKIAIKTLPDKIFNIFLLNENKYLKEVDYEEYVEGKDYDSSYIFVEILNADILKNCVILSTPLVYNRYPRANGVRESKYLTTDSVLSLIKYEQLSDFVLYFEVITNFFTIERCAAVKYLLKRRFTEKGALKSRSTVFVASKSDLYPISGDKDGSIDLITKIKQDDSFKYIDGLKNEDKKGHFYKGPFSFRHNDEKFLFNCIKELDSELKGYKKLQDKIEAFFQEYNHDFCLPTELPTEKTKIRKLLEDDVSKENTKETRNDNYYSKKIRTALEECISDVESQLSDIIKESKVPIEQMGDMIDCIKNISEKIEKEYLEKCSWLDRNYVSPFIQFILDNILIPYFLMEGSFKIGDENTWSTKIRNELKRFRNDNNFSKIESLLGIIPQLS